MSLHSKRVRIALGTGAIVTLGLFGYNVLNRSPGVGSMEGTQIGENLDLSEHSLKETQVQSTTGTQDGGVMAPSETSSGSQGGSSWTSVLSGLFGGTKHESDSSEKHESGVVVGGALSGSSTSSAESAAAMGTAAGALTTGVAGAAGTSTTGAGSVATATSTTGAALTVAGQANAAPTQPVVEEKPRCETRTFATSKNERFETNVIALGDLSGGKFKVRPESFCVRVNGAPTKFELDSKKWEIQVGALRKSVDKVTVTYCRGSASCTENCAIAKDPFMEALVGEDGAGDDDGEETAGWAPDSKLGAEMASREEKELDGELQRFQHVLEGGNGPKVKGMNKAWSEAAHVEACTASSVAKLR